MNIGINVSVYGKCLVESIGSMAKKRFGVNKKHFLAKNALFSKKNISQTKIFFGLIQAPNMSKHISRNRWATVKASQKTAHDKKLIILGQKVHVIQTKNGGTIKKML